MKKILDIVEKILCTMIGVLICVMVVIIFMQVVLRYGFKSATNWADEVARYCMIWVVFLGSAVGYRRHSHIRVDVITRYLPRKAQKILEFFMYVLQIVFLGVVVRYGVQYIASIKNQSSMALRINMQYVHLATVLGSGLMLLFIIERICEDMIFSGKDTGKGADE